ncbi:MAG: hypothetical protein EB120_12450, partial [Proteobacteria bacterium]|nr:hypothetical protein [Pseudomonadota bacterium]
MQFKKFICLGLVLVGTLHLEAASYEKLGEKKLFNGETVQEYKFPNGLKVLMVARSQAPVLTYQTWFDVGSLNEKLDKKLNKTGLAHLFE